MQIRKTLNTIINKTPNRRKIVKNVSWAVAGKIVNVIYALFIGVLVARYLGPEQFGLMNYVISYVTLFSIIATFGLNGIEVRELAKMPEKKDAILGTAFIIRFILSLFTILTIIITLLIFESDKYTMVMVIVYSSYLIASSMDVIRNYFTSIVQNEYVVKTEIIRTIVGAGIKILLLVNKCSLTWFIVANTFDFFFIAGGYMYSYRKKVGNIMKWTFDLRIAKFLSKESFPLLLSGAATIIYQRIDQIMIRNMIDNSALGQFSVALRITNLVVFIPNIIASTITPILVEAKQKNYKLYLKKREQFMDGIIWSSILMALIVSITANPAISLLFGDKYLDAIPVLQILAWKAVLIGLFVGSGQIMIIENIQRWAVLRNLIGMLICVIANYLLIPTLGIIGSAIATLITMLFTGFIAHIFIKPYRFLFKMQLNSLIFGLRRFLFSTILNLKTDEK